MLLAITEIPPDVEVQRHLTSIHIDVWLREDVFHFRWWILIAFLLISSYVWWKFLDKSRLDEILLFAGLTTILTMAIIEYGEELTLWDYPTDIIPIFPPLTSFNLAIMPIIYSLIYQYFRTWKSYILAVIIVTAAICFIFEPILELGGFFQMLNWKYYYSFFIYSVMAIIMKAVLIKFVTILEKARNKL